MRSLTLVQVYAVLPPTEWTHPAAMIAAFHRSLPLTVDNAPRRVPGFLIALIDQAPRSRDSGVRGQVDIARQARDIDAVVFHHVNQVFQRARVTHRSVYIRHHQRVALATA